MIISAGLIGALQFPLFELAHAYENADVHVCIYSFCFMNNFPYLIESKILLISISLTTNVIMMQQKKHSIISATMLYVGFTELNRQK